ncbi:hypothetical protein PFISCL1PPCAC_15819, partial [Pristionchus fissidentatus]
FLSLLQLSPQFHSSFSGKSTMWAPAALVFIGLASAASLPEHRHIPECPKGARPLLRPDGQPRKCLPHQNNLCVNALPDKPDAETVCCFHNQVDYFCCLDATEEQCPDYQQVTVVIHNSLPHDPFALRSYFFKEGIEDELVEEAFAKHQDAPTNEDGFLVRRQL